MQNQIFALMSSQQRPKRLRTHLPDAAPVRAQLLGRDQLVLKSPELQSRLGQRYCDESELLPLLLSHGLVSRVRTIEVAVHPLGGDNFKIRLDATKPSVGEAKAEIARLQGTEEARQELYKVAVRADGGAVREDDAEAEPLDEEGAFLGDGEVVAMAVKELPPFVWRTIADDRVALSEEGAVATLIMAGEEGSNSLTTTGVELTEGKHYWEVELLSESTNGEIVDIDCFVPTHSRLSRFLPVVFRLNVDILYLLVLGILIGISKPNLDPTGSYYNLVSIRGWFMRARYGALCGYGKYNGDGAGGYMKGDRMGMLLDLGVGSLRFFRNGAQHGPGYAAGSVAGPVVAALQMWGENASVRLLPNAQQPQ
jgi:hypothetical protein